MTQFQHQEASQLRRRRHRATAAWIVWGLMIGGLVFAWVPAQSVRGQDALEAPAVRIDQLDADTLKHAWRPLFRGVDHLALAAETPRRLRGQALRIDLTTPGLSFVVSPSNGERPLEADSVTTSAFLAAEGLDAAINCAPFGPVVNDSGVPQDIVGLAIREGMVISPPDPAYDALVLDRSNHARIVSQQALIEGGEQGLEGIWTACGGFKIILKAGEILPGDDPVHPRSAVGVSQDGQFLILLAIDGRQPLHSMGAMQRETADWLRKLGAWDGLNLDGGGSTSLVVRDNQGAARILNRPIHQGKPGLERPCPNHLGLKVSPRERQSP
ncbi:hypothetical protein Isop_2217 [Isosphaera pallida ATCC 43644]|uniref:Phosphodiester glycosidase domain-containing protein n=1 Tax=Isosphaera pallida (strain ATCC 43644 / DSM 9630 / IS1B) TaxID=575540 RepID=E8R538_ISOPI|nr:phosphodiester glycosidase family protein [Isosphaera pallida]ADV62795.1 hypothetical protein Isop_2217 [Isosphaera pallida ATCC 43644]